MCQPRSERVCVNNFVCTDSKKPQPERKESFFLSQISRESDLFLPSCFCHTHLAR